MLGKLAGLAKNARDAVASVDINAVKDKIVSVGSDVAERVGDRMVHPADAYDEALRNVAEETPGHDALLRILSRLKDDNPYR